MPKNYLCKYCLQIQWSGMSLRKYIKLLDAELIMSRAYERSYMHYHDLLAEINELKNVGCTCGTDLKPTNTEHSIDIRKHMCEDICGKCDKCILWFDKHFLPSQQLYVHDK